MNNARAHLVAGSAVFPRAARTTSVRPRERSSSCSPRTIREQVAAERFAQVTDIAKPSAAAVAAAFHRHQIDRARLPASTRAMSERADARMFSTTRMR